MSWASCAGFQRQKRKRRGSAWPHLSVTKDQNNAARLTCSGSAQGGRIFPAMLEISDFMPADQFNDALPEPIRRVESFRAMTFKLLQPRPTRRGIKLAG